MKPLATDGQHIEISRLWQYSRSANRAILPAAEFDHMSRCEDCVGVLWMWHIASSIADVKEWVQGRSIKSVD